MGEWDLRVVPRRAGQTLWDVSNSVEHISPTLWAPKREKGERWEDCDESLPLSYSMLLFKGS